MTDGSILRKCRKKAGFSQEELAELLHINQSDISKIEKDKKEVGIRLFRDWTQATNAMDIGIGLLFGIDPAAVLQMLLQAAGAA